MSIERVIVGYDGSELAREAFELGLVLAAPLKARVHAMHVLEPALMPALGGDPSMMLDPMTPAVILPEADEATREAAQATAHAWFDELAAACKTRGVAFSSEVLSGVLIDVLSQEATSRDLIAVGLKGRFRRTGVGSTTRWLVNHAPCPVLVASGPRHPINRVLAAYDGTDVSSRGAMFARELAQGLKWPLTILALPRAKFTLDQALQWGQTIAPEAQVINEAADSAGGGEAAVIERVVGKDPSALLVMGAYADSWLKDLFTGSTTGHVLTHLKSPIILVHGR